MGVWARVVVAAVNKMKQSRYLVMGLLLGAAWIIGESEVEYVLV